MIAATQRRGAAPRRERGLRFRFPGPILGRRARCWEWEEDEGGWRDQ